MSTGPDPLKDLFQVVGAEHAPDDLERTVLKRLAQAQPKAALPERPLIPKWVWGAVVASCAALFTVPQPASHQWEMPTLPSLTMSPMMGWVLVAMACGLTLFALDPLLSRWAKAQRA